MIVADYLRVLVTGEFFLTVSNTLTIFSIIFGLDI